MRALVLGSLAFVTVVVPVVMVLVIVVRTAVEAHRKAMEVRRKVMLEEFDGRKLEWRREPPWRPGPLN